ACANWEDSYPVAETQRRSRRKPRKHEITRNARKILKMIRVFVGFVFSWLPFAQRVTGRGYRLSDRSARFDPSVFRHDDDAGANVIAIAVRVLHACVVDETGAVAHGGVLVDDDAIEYDVAANTEHCGTVG